MKIATILEKGQAWVCPTCGTRYPGEQPECIVCPIMGGEGTKSAPPR